MPADQLEAFPLRGGSKDAALQTTLDPLAQFTVYATAAAGTDPGGAILVEVYAP